MDCTIITYEEREDLRPALLQYLRDCEWGAAKLLADLHIKNNFFSDDDRTYFLMSGNDIISFLTLARRDCIADENLFPWIGFVYTDTKYRGHRYSEKLIRRALEDAGRKGFSRVYLATDHTGLYEKFGFVFKENRPDINNEDSRIYVYDFPE
ncbi:GNAT family N-acetyltransferase [Brucepastera parasyntrophica]|uniref:GNAT family N-acetyltransferase n=1 Tax=Brucepastera parasyntrophica TaxID=2880008 RepID=UPI002108E420|nr:GNAT family N-acetyltransferase [Brucepastera parasyntrophica]ULQ58910.1 GNAT family N-acetyltransferase [Brucepastera parasyntrophica]